MTSVIKHRVEQIRAGKVPEGYIKTKAGMMPTDWNVNKKANEIFKSHTDKKHGRDLEILAATQEKGIVPRSQIDIDIKCSDEGISGYKKVDAGDFIISLRSFQGGIEYSPYSGILSPAYTVLKPVIKIADEYYKNYFKTESFISRLNGAVYGIRDGKQIGYEDFGDLVVHNPPLPEQQKIAEILMQCDKVIELQQDKIEELRKLKKACLAKMFPKAGSNVPEVRFPDFTGAWEQRKWSETVDISTEMVDPKCGEYDNLPHVAPGNIESFTGRVFDNVKTVKEENLISGKFHFYAGDVIYGKINPQLGKYAFAECEGLTSADAYVLNSKNGLDQKFLFTLIQSDDFYRYTVSVSKRSGMPKINRDELNSFAYLSPSTAEQAQIGELFLSLDHLITLYQRELEEMQQKKKALMQLLLTGIVRVVI